MTGQLLLFWLQLHEIWKAAATSFWGAIGLNKNERHSFFKDWGKMEDEACQMYIYISWNTAMPRAPHPPWLFKGTTALDSLPPCCMFSNLIRLLHTHYFYFLRRLPHNHYSTVFYWQKCRWSLDSRPTAFKVLTLQYLYCKKLGNRNCNTKPFSLFIGGGMR